METLESQTLGGLSPVTYIDGDVRKCCELVRNAIREKLGRDFEMFLPVMYRRQVVAGTNFFVKILIDQGGECVHARIFQPLQGAVALEVLQVDKRIENPIEPF